MKSNNDKPKPKYESYRAAFKIMEEAKRTKNLPYCIAAISIAESIIADRCQSYLYGVDKKFIEEYKKEFIPTDILIKEARKHFKPNKLEIIKKEFKTNDLFKGLINWLKRRNKIIHGFAKSKPGTPTINMDQFVIEAVKTAEEGLELANRIKKWHQKELRNSKK